MSSSENTAPRSKVARPRKTEAPALCTFMSEVRDAADFAERFRTQFLEEYPQGLDSEFMFRTAQAVFEADVARKKDLKNHILLRKLRQTDRAQDESHRQRERAIEQRERQLELAREKFEFDAAAAVLDHLGELREIAGNRTLKHPMKIQAVRHRLFGAPPPSAEASAAAASFTPEPTDPYEGQLRAPRTPDAPF